MKRSNYRFTLREVFFAVFAASVTLAWLLDAGCFRYSQSPISRLLNHCHESRRLSGPTAAPVVVTQLAATSAAVK